jgi:hypothetical protein
MSSRWSAVRSFEAGSPSNDNLYSSISNFCQTSHARVHYRHGCKGHLTPQSFCASVLCCVASRRVFPLAPLCTATCLEALKVTRVLPSVEWLLLSRVCRVAGWHTRKTYDRCAHREREPPSSAVSGKWERRLGGAVEVPGSYLHSIADGSGTRAKGMKLWL